MSSVEHNLNNNDGLLSQHPWNVIYYSYASYRYTRIGAFTALLEARRQQEETGIPSSAVTITCCSARIMTRFHQLWNAIMEQNDLRTTWLRQMGAFERIQLKVTDKQGNSLYPSIYYIPPEKGKLYGRVIRPQQAESPIKRFIGRIPGFEDYNLDFSRVTDATPEDWLEHPFGDHLLEALVPKDYAQKIFTIVRGY